MKKFLPSILKYSLLTGSIVFLGWILISSGILKFLLEDKSPKSTVDEGKYILNKLAEDYEQFLTARRAALDKEAQFLLSEQGISKTLSEKEAIARRLGAIQNEKKSLNDEYQKNLKKKAEIEANLASIRQELALSSKEMTKLSDEYKNLLKEKEKSENYWKNYVNEIVGFFSNYKNKNDVAEKFKQDNGKNYIINEYSSLLARVNEQNFLLQQNKNKHNRIANESRNLESKIDEYEKTLEYYNNFSEVIKKFQNILVNYASANASFRQRILKSRLKIIKK